MVVAAGEGKASLCKGKSRCHAHNFVNSLESWWGGGEGRGEGEEEEESGIIGLRSRLGEDRISHSGKVAR